MRSTSFTFRDHDDIAVHARTWAPDRAPARALVQISHGMQEHVGRYERAAAALVDAGFAVYANDHRGHGRTAASAEELGRLGSGGWQSVLLGLRRTTEIATDENPGLPVFLLGHSFGSFLVQAYIQRWADGLAGAVLSGTNGRNFLLRPGLLVAKLIARKEGLEATATTLREMSVGKYNKPFEPGTTGKEWLSRDPETVREYVDDPLCGGDVPNSFFIELITMLDAIWRPEGERRIPCDLPIYMFSGSECPVGNRTRGVESLARRYRRHGLTDVTVRFYRGGRHEMLNEINCEEVYADLVAWIDKHC
jgi:alpha-beta hydrolase superfamily lysophospholipase